MVFSVVVVLFIVSLAVVVSIHPSVDKICVVAFVVGAAVDSGVNGSAHVIDELPVTSFVGVSVLPDMVVDVSPE